MSIFNFSHPLINLLKNFDIELQDFNYDVLHELKKTRKKPNHQPKPSKHQPKNLNLDKKTTSEGLTKRDFPKPIERAEFVFRFNPCYISAMAHHLLRMINKNPMIFRDALWKRCINICCFGGNLAVEIVALSKIFSSSQECFWQSTRQPLHFKVTFIDKNRVWKKTIRAILQTMIETKSIFDLSTMSISFEFVEADFNKPFNSSVREIIGEADIVTMVKFFCPRRIQMVSSKISLFAQDVARSMKPKSVLFYLDSGMHFQWEILVRSLRVLNDIQCIYGPIKLEAFTLDLNSIKRCVQLFWSKKQTICLTSCIVSSCAWIKLLDDEVSEKQILVSSDINKRFGSLERKKIYLKACSSELDLQKFHMKVFQIIPNRTLADEDDDFCVSDNSKDNLCEKRVLFPTKSKSKRIYVNFRIY